MIKLNPLQKKKLIQTYPDLASVIEQQETNAMLDMILKQRDEEFKATRLIKGDKGDKGDAGYTPIKGKDYFDGEDGVTPVYGIDYTDGLDGYTPIKGVDYTDGQDGLDGKDGTNGRDGTEITPQEIANRINTLQKAINSTTIDGMLTIEDIRTELTSPKSKHRIKGKELDMSDMRWHGGGLSSVAHDSTLTGNGTTSSPLSVVSTGGMPGGSTGDIQYNNSGIFGGITAARGDLLYGSAAGVWSKLADIATGNALISGGIGLAPSWGKIGLTTHVSGVLPVANGGTGTSTSFAPGSIPFASSTGDFTQSNNNLFFDNANKRLNIGQAGGGNGILTVTGGNGTVPTMTLGGNLKQSDFNWTPFANERQQIFSGAFGSDGYGDMLLALNDTEAADKNLGYVIFGQKITGKSANNAGLKGSIGMISKGSGGTTSGFGADMVFNTKPDNSADTWLEGLRITKDQRVSLQNDDPVGRFQIGSGMAGTYACGTISINTFSAVINYDDATGSFPTLGYTHGRIAQAYYDSPLGRVYDTTQYYMSDYGGDVTDDGTSSATNSVTTSLQYDVASGSVSGVLIYDYDTYNPYNYDTNFDLGDCSTLVTFDDFNDLWGGYTTPTPVTLSNAGTDFIVALDGKSGFGLDVPLEKVHVNAGNIRVDNNGLSVIIGDFVNPGSQMGLISNINNVNIAVQDVSLDSLFYGTNSGNNGITINYASGFIGFNQGSPAYYVDFAGDGGGTGMARFLDDYSSNELIIGTSSVLGTDIGLWSNTGIINIGDGNNDAVLNLVNTGAGIGASIRADGNNYFNADGMGYTSFNAASGNALVYISDRGLTDTNASFAIYDNDGGTYAMQVFSSGLRQVGFGGDIAGTGAFILLDYGNPRITVTDYGSGVVQSQISGDQTNTTKNFFLADSGFGTNAPTQKVDVNGTIRLRGAIYDQANSAGSAGNIFANNGSGGAWTTSAALKLPSPLFDHFADAGNGTTVETDLYSDTLAAGQLAANGDKIEGEYGGVFVSSATATRQIRLKFAGTTIFDTGTLTLSLSAAWTMYVSLIRVSSTVIRYMISLTTEGAALSAYTAVGELTGLTLSGTNILKITGQAAGVGAATNDIVAKMAAIAYHPAA